MYFLEGFFLNEKKLEFIGNILIFNEQEIGHVFRKFYFKALLKNHVHFYNSIKPVFALWNDYWFSINYFSRAESFYFVNYFGHGNAYASRYRLLTAKYHEDLVNLYSYDLCFYLEYLSKNLKIAFSLLDYFKVHGNSSNCNFLAKKNIGLESRQKEMEVPLSSVYGGAPSPSKYTNINKKYDQVDIFFIESYIKSYS